MLYRCNLETSTQTEIIMLRSRGRLKPTCLPCEGQIIHIHTRTHTHTHKSITQIYQGGNLAYREVARQQAAGLAWGRGTGGRFSPPRGKGDGGGRRKWARGATRERDGHDISIRCPQTLTKHSRVDSSTGLNWTPKTP